MTTDEKLRRLEARLQNLYRDAEEEMRGKWDEYMSRQEKKAERLRARILQAKTPADKLAAEAAYREHLNAVTSGSAHFRDMVRSLSENYANANRRALAIINGKRSEFFADGYNLSAGEINGAAIDADVGIRFDLVDASTIEWLVERTVDEPEKVIMPPPEKLKIPEDERWSAKLIQSQVAQGIAQGESIPKIAKRLEKVTDNEAAACIRRARTMVTDCENAGRVRSMKQAEEMGVRTRKQWVCTHDDRTRDTHLQLDGETIDKDATFWNGCRWPGDHLGPPAEVWNCRCTLVTVVDGFESTLPRGKQGAIRVRFGGEEEVLSSDMSGAWNLVRQLREAKPASDMTSDDLKEIGRAFYDSDEYGKIPDEIRLADADAALGTYNDAITEYNKAVAIFNEWADPFVIKSAEDNALWDAKHAEIVGPARDKMNEAREAYNRAEELSVKRKETVSELIAEARGEGRGFSSAEQQTNHLGRTTDARKAVADGYGRYPESWVKASTDRGSLTVRKVSRGYYSDWKNELMVSSTGENAQNTAVHEIGHRMERVRGLVDAERRYYNERTAGESAKWLGAGYGRDEVARRDKFVSAYMGKDYGGSAFELVSMATEGVIGFTNRVDLTGDKDMRDWITGILLAY